MLRLQRTRMNTRLFRLHKSVPAPGHYTQNCGELVKFKKDNNNETDNKTIYSSFPCDGCSNHKRGGCSDDNKSSLQLDKDDG